MKRPGDDNVTHVGIVSDVENAKIMKMIHAAGEVKGIVEAKFPSGIAANTYWGPLYLGLGRPR